jgi:hypothetical protein
MFSLKPGSGFEFKFRADGKLLVEGANARISYVVITSTSVWREGSAFL